MGVRDPPPMGASDPWWAQVTHGRKWPTFHWCKWPPCLYEAICRGPIIPFVTGRGPPWRGHKTKDPPDQSCCVVPQVDGALLQSSRQQDTEICGQRVWHPLQQGRGLLLSGNLPWVILKSWATWEYMKRSQKMSNWFEGWALDSFETWKYSRCFFLA